MGLSTLVLIILLVLLVGAAPTWPHSRNWGYMPSSTVGLVLIVMLVLMAMGRR